LGRTPVQAIILGCGTSHGVPMIGCDCAVCTSDNPRDKRTRTSCLVRVGETHLPIDTAPELRLQCVANGINRVDAVLFTHHHADHVTGLDDLRRFNWLTKRSMSCYGTERTLAGVRRMFSYAFEPAPDSPHSRPRLNPVLLDGSPLEIGGTRVVPLPLMHGPLPVLGFRIGRLAYCTDCNQIPDESMALLNDLDALVLGALRRDPHPAHFTLDEAVDVAKQIGAARTFFTHTTHQLGYAETNSYLPNGMELAYDGLSIDV